MKAHLAVIIFGIVLIVAVTALNSCCICHKNGNTTFSANERDIELALRNNDCIVYR